MTAKPGRQAMARLLQRSGIHLTNPQLSLLWRYHRLLHQKGAALDLTRIRNFENMVVKHYVDSMIIPELVDLPSPLLDMGTGAGLPGIPIKIARPHLEIILAEGRAKRVSFLEEVCRDLGLKGVEVFPHRVGPSFSLPVAGVITRALESMEKTFERAARFLQPGGVVIFMKGPRCDEELNAALARFGEEFRLLKDHAYALEGTPHRRRLVVFERMGGAGPGLKGGKVVSLARDSERSQMKIREIRSGENPVFKRFLRVSSSRGIKKEGLAVLAGTKAVRETLSDFPTQCAGLLLSEKHALPRPRETGAIPLFRLSAELFSRLDISGTHGPLLVVRVPDMRRWHDATWPRGCTLFLPFQDPVNVGAAIRTAAAFGVAQVVLLEEAAHPFHPKALRAAGSAVFRVPLLRGPALGSLKAQSIPLLALSPEGRDLGSVRFPKAFGLVPGVEGPGLPEGLRGEDLVGIPMEAGLDSLNAALATGIALYAWRQGLKRSP